MQIDFQDPDDWRFISDQVMGGVSTGRVDFHAADGRHYATLAGDVSTENNGGFIQIRRDVDGLPASATAMVLTVRGNGAAYKVHLRTRQSERPWHYFAASFDAPAEWTDITLPLADFAPNKDHLQAPVHPTDVRSIGIVAYGADYHAKLDIAGIVLR
ncbi:CIA30 family protein [Loktanella sp. TSTF-M6]|uniref:CIA30 family protein n=1 Tax=Loktanella gaetbuli TaxID=2881335 RepID=A0ABS8BSE5_9RHOB|nr:CIA30 family protein [Loktanella gaetbuli]MCB5198663.1 CIA30 family protein [Loktanella gaetbuli]